MKKTLYWLPLAALLMAGCSSDYTPSEQQDGPVPIHLTVSVNDLTRATTAIQSAQFGANQTFYAYFPTGVTPSTTTFETSDASGNTICTGTQPYFNQSATSASVHAYYPYVTGENGATVTNATTSFTVQTAQNVDDNYRLSDLMYGTTASAIAKDSKSVTAALTFTHRLSKIIINATAGSGISEIQEIRIIGGYRTIAITDGTTLTLNAEASGLSDANSTTSYITMYAGGSATTANCAAIIPPQTIDGNFIQVVTDKGTATYALSSKAFAGAYQYTTNLTVNLAAINATTTITPWSEEDFSAPGTFPAQSLGELTNIINSGGAYSEYLGYYVKADGSISSSSTDAVGIIAYMSTEDMDEDVPGSRILVLSSSDETSTYAWASDTDVSGASTSITAVNGYSNTKVLTAKYGNTYAAGVCWSKTAVRGGSNWFLPSKAQWENIQGTNGIGKGTHDNSITGIINTATYWSSTEYGNNTTLGWNLATASDADASGYLLGGSNKTNSIRVRACFAYPSVYASLTSAHIGWLLTSEGNIYAHAKEAEAAGETPVAMICYVGSDTGEDSPYTHGLAISLYDASGGNINYTDDFGDRYNWKNSKGVNDGTTEGNSGFVNSSGKTDAATWPAFVAAASNNGAVAPTNSTGWFMASKYQWGKTICGSVNGGFDTNAAFRNAFKEHGVDKEFGYGYWTSTESSTDYVWTYNFQDETPWYGTYKYSDISTAGRRVRSFLAF